MKQLGIVGFCFLLAACAAAAPEPVARARPAPVEPATRVAEVRALGATGAELEVAPLRDPHVEDLLAQAMALEQQGKAMLASAALDRALAITPGAPDLLQWQAELALLRHAWEDAEQLANASYEGGPRLGGLCRRNWSTIGHARDARGDTAGATIARRQIDACTVAPPVRS